MEILGRIGHWKWRVIEREEAGVTPWFLLGDREGGCSLARGEVRGTLKPSVRVLERDLGWQRD